jgi:hypothetical protein
MTLAELASAIIAREKWTMNVAHDTYKITLRLPSGRTQVVRLTSFDHEGNSMVRFTSEIGPDSKLDPSRRRAALELNARFPTGCLAIDSDALVVTDTRPLATTTPESSAVAIRYIAGQADTYERFIFRTDTH